MWSGPNNAQLLDSGWLNQRRVGNLIIVLVIVLICSCIGLEGPLPLAACPFCGARECGNILWPLCLTCRSAPTVSYISATALGVWSTECDPECDSECLLHVLSSEVISQQTAVLPSVGKPSRGVAAGGCSAGDSFCFFIDLSSALAAAQYHM